MKIIAVILFVLCLRAFYLVIKTQSMSDIDRTELGLGPKGQGR